MPVRSVPPLYPNNNKKALKEKVADVLASSRLYHWIGDLACLSLSSKSQFIRRCQKEPASFRVLEMIYDNQPCGDTPFRTFADWYYLNSPMARAARQRLLGVVNWITTRSEQIIKEKDEIHILSLACGGARDAILALSNKDWRHQVSFLGIDNDNKP